MSDWQIADEFQDPRYALEPLCKRLATHHRIFRSRPNLPQPPPEANRHSWTRRQQHLNFRITKEEVTKREVSEAEENVLIEALREDFHDIFVFALLSGIAGGGLCAQMTFRSKRHRGDPPGFIRWETQALGPVEVALLAEILAAKHHPKYVFTYVSQGKKGRDRQERRLRGGQLPDHARDADDPLAARRVTERFLTQASLRVLRSGREPKLPRKSCHLMSATEGGLTQHQHHHCAHIASLALQKLQGKLQGRPNLKVVG